MEVAKVIQHPRYHSERAYEDSLEQLPCDDGKVSQQLHSLIDDDAWTYLSASPRSRFGSESFFDELEILMESSKFPPVGTTLPPLYPRKQRKRVFKRLVNRPIKP